MPSSSAMPWSTTWQDDLGRRPTTFFSEIVRCRDSLPGCYYEGRASCRNRLNLPPPRCAPVIVENARSLFETPGLLCRSSCRIGRGLWHAPRAFASASGRAFLQLHHFLPGHHGHRSPGGNGTRVSCQRDIRVHDAAVDFPVAGARGGCRGCGRSRARRFPVMGVFMSIVAELYRAARRRAASYEEQLSLRESEARFSTVFHASPISMSILRLSDGRYQDVNQAFLDLYGRPRDEVIGRTSIELGLWRTRASGRAWSACFATLEASAEVKRGFAGNPERNGSGGLSGSHRVSRRTLRVDFFPGHHGEKEGGGCPAGKRSPVSRNA